MGIDHLVTPTQITITIRVLTISSSNSRASKIIHIIFKFNFEYIIVKEEA